VESLRLVGQAGSWARRPGWPGGDEGRRLLLRYAAPAAFLLVVTVLALALRGGLRTDARPTAAHPGAKRAEASSTATRAKPAAPKRWYVIQSGDTLGAIATRYGTTVDALLRLNPGVVPTALAPGSQVRIR
jgi:Tfp pilus assembly protein FimV